MNQYPYDDDVPTDPTLEQAVSAYEDALYVELFGRTAQQLSDETGEVDPRDGMTIEALRVLSTADKSLAQLLKDNADAGEKLTMFQVLLLAKVYGMYVLMAVIEPYQEQSRLDFATGRPLLQA